jgi:hypothetical protein
VAHILDRYDWHSTFATIQTRTTRRRSPIRA